MKRVNIYEAKTHLSELVRRASEGEEIVIARAGTPLARLVPFRSDERPERRPGRARGRIRISDDFDAPLPPEIADAFGVPGP